MASGSTMSFPTMTEEEIINFCKEMVGAEIPITQAALRNPTMESTMAMFRFFVNDIFGWDLDSALVVPFSAMSQAQYFEMHRDQVPVLRFYNVIRSLLKHVHYDSFSIEDLLQPQPKRLRRQLSALANFALHKQKTMEEYGDGVQEKINQNQLYQERLVEENRALKSNVHKQIERKDELEEMTRKEHELVEELNQEITSLHNEKEQLNEENKQTRAENARLENQLSEFDVEDAKLNEEMSRLEAQLVGSPEKVRQTLTRAQEELQSAEEQREAATRRRQELRHVRQQSQQLAAGLERSQQRVDVLRDLDERLREEDNKIKSVTEEMEATRLEMSELRSASRQQANRCEMIEESREGQLQKNKRYLKAKEEELDKRQQVLEETRARLAADQQEAARLDGQQQELQLREQQDAELYQQQLETLQRQEKQLVEAVEWVKAESDRQQNELFRIIDEE